MPSVSPEARPQHDAVTTEDTPSPDSRKKIEKTLSDTSSDPSRLPCEDNTEDASISDARPDQATPTYRPRLGPFESLRYLPAGSCSETFMVRDLGHRKGERFLCLKMFKKKALKRKQILGCVMSELLAYKRLASFERCAASAFVMEVDAAFQDEKRLFLIMVIFSLIISL
jgi:hypothetical protein